MKKDRASEVAKRYLKEKVQAKGPFEYKKPHVPVVSPPQDRPEKMPVLDRDLAQIFKSLPVWEKLKKKAPDPERAEEEYEEDSTFDSKEYSPGGKGYRGQWKAFRKKYGDKYLPNPLPKGSYFGWQPKVQIDTLIEWTDGEGSSNPVTAQYMQSSAARIVEPMYDAFRRSQTTR